MERLTIGSLPIPKIYIVTEGEVDKAKQMGLPFLVRPKGMSNETIAKFVLLNTLEHLMPYVDWRKVFSVDKFETIVINVPACEDCATHTSGSDEPDTTHVADIADGYREFTGGIGSDYGERSLEQYVGDLSAHVSIEELQALHMLPTFLDNIASAIKKNIFGYEWTEGYNKKRGVPVGNFDASSEKNNLIILDVSGSIPRGISATMLTLIGTLKEVANAALIVTGSTSYFWDAGDALPSPQELRNAVGYGNESEMFHDILKQRIAGRHWGNVIVFGDGDRPCKIKTEEYESGRNRASAEDMAGTTVDKLWNFHTGNWYGGRSRKNPVPGYALWVRELGLDPEEEFNTKWCKFMER